MRMYRHFLDGFRQFHRNFGGGNFVRSARRILRLVIEENRVLGANFGHGKGADITRGIGIQDAAGQFAALDKLLDHHIIRHIEDPLQGRLKLQQALGDFHAHA